MRDEAAFSQLYNNAQGIETLKLKELKLKGKTVPKIFEIWISEGYHCNDIGTRIYTEKNSSNEQFAFDRNPGLKRYRLLETLLTGEVEPCVCVCVRIMK